MSLSVAIWPYAGVVPYTTEQATGMVVSTSSVADLGPMSMNSGSAARMSLIGRTTISWLESAAEPQAAAARASTGVSEFRNIWRGIRDTPSQSLPVERA